MFCIFWGVGGGVWQFFIFGGPSAKNPVDPQNPLYFYDLEAAKGKMGPPELPRLNVGPDGGGVPLV